MQSEAPERDGAPAADDGDAGGENGAAQTVRVRAVAVGADEVDVNAVRGGGGLASLYELRVVRGAVLERFCRWVATRPWMGDVMDEAVEEDDAVLEPSVYAPPLELLHAPHLSLVFSAPGHGKTCLLRHLLRHALAHLPPLRPPAVLAPLDMRATPFAPADFPLGGTAEQYTPRQMFSASFDAAPNIMLHTPRPVLPLLASCADLPWSALPAEPADDAAAAPPMPAVAWSAADLQAFLGAALDATMRALEPHAAVERFRELLRAVIAAAVPRLAAACEAMCRRSGGGQAPSAGEAGPAEREGVPAAASGEWLLSDVTLLVDDLDLLSAGASRRAVRTLLALRAVVGEAERGLRPETARRCLGVVAAARPERVLEVRGELGDAKAVSSGERNPHVNALHLEPGPLFRVCVVDEVPPPLLGWSPVRDAFRRMELVSGSARVAFLDGLRSARTKLYPVREEHPLLLFLLARRLARRALQPVAVLSDDGDRSGDEMGAPTGGDALSSPNEPGSDGAVDGGGGGGDGGEDAMAVEATEAASDGGARDDSASGSAGGGGDGAADGGGAFGGSAGDGFGDEHSVSLAELLDALVDEYVGAAWEDERGPARAAWRSAEALTRACGLLGLLAHWRRSGAFHGSALLDLDAEPGGNGGSGGSGGRRRARGARGRVTVRALAEWFVALMEDDRTAYLLGYKDTGRGDAAAGGGGGGAATDSDTGAESEGGEGGDGGDMEEGVCVLSVARGEAAVRALIAVLPTHFKLTGDGRVLHTHPLLEQHLAARFLSERDDCVEPLLACLREHANGVDFSWRAPHLFTDHRWDYVVHLCALRRGVHWLYARIMPPRSHSALDQWLSQLALSHSDADDYAQLRFHALLRAYAAVSLHRPVHKTHTDPLTNAFGSTLLRLLHHSHAGALVHLNAFPVYHLACFHAHAARSIMEKCLDPFLNRCSTQALKLLVRLYRCPLMGSHTRTLVEHFQMGETRRRLSIVRLLGEVDQWRLRRENIGEVVNALGDSEGMVRREAINIIHGLGMESARLFPPGALKTLFLDGNVEAVVSSSVNLLTKIVEFSHLGSHFTASERRVLEQYHNQLSGVVELLAQPDPGGRLLAFLALHNPRLYRFYARIFAHEPLSKSEIREHEEYNAKARDALLVVCRTLMEAEMEGQAAAGDAIDSAGGAVGSDGERSRVLQRSFGGGGTYSLTVTLSAVVADVLGERASCWVSSFAEMLQRNEELMRMILASVFASVSTAAQARALRVLTAADHTTAMLALNLLGACAIDSIVPHLPLVTAIVADSARQIAIRMRAGEIYAKVVRRAPAHVSFPFLLRVASDTARAPAASALFMFACSLAQEVAPRCRPSYDVEHLNGMLAILAAHKRNHYPLTLAAVALFEQQAPLPRKHLRLCWPVFLALLEDAHAEVRSSAAKCLAQRFGRFVAPGSELVRRLVALFDSPKWFVRAAAVSALSLLAKRFPSRTAARSQAIGAEVLQQLEDASASRTVIECGIRVLCQVCEHAPEGSLDRIAGILLTRPNDFRLQACALDAMARFGERSMRYVSAVVECLGAPDLEVRHAAANCLTALQPFLTKELFRSKEISGIMESFRKSDDSHRRNAALVATEAFGMRTVIEGYETVIALLADRNLAIVTDTMKMLRACFAESAVEARMLFGKEVIKLMSHAVPRIRAAAIRLARCDASFAREVRPLVVVLFCKRTQHIKVRIQALRLIGLTGDVPEECIPGLIVLLRVTETRVLSTVTGALTDAAEKAAVVVPKLINAMEPRELNGMKRKLSRFMEMHGHALCTSIPAVLPDAVQMLACEDSMVRRKAVALIGTLALALGTLRDRTYVGQAWEYVVRELTRALVDRNSLVRRGAAVVLGAIGRDHAELRAAIVSRMLPRGKPPHHYSVSTWRILSVYWQVLLPV